MTIPVVVLKYAFGILKIFSLLFRGIIFLRNALFDRSIFVKKVSCRVISVGNLAVGGTGKTPYVMFCIEKFKRQGLKVAVLMRGYKGKRSADRVCVSSGSGRLLMTAQEAGEEAFLIAEKFPDVPVYVHPSRHKIALLALKNHNVDLCLLDDGFQHRFLWRDEDIVLWNAWDDPYTEALLPSGKLREPLSSLRRASSVVITKIDGVAPQKVEKMVKTFQKYCSSVKTMREKALHWIVYPEKHTHPCNFLENRSCLLFCALGSPQNFCFLVESLKVTVNKKIFFRDHHSFSDRDTKFLEKEMKSTQSDFLVCTMKDKVKLPKSFPCCVLMVDLEECS